MSNSSSNHFIKQLLPALDAVFYSLAEFCNIGIAIDVIAKFFNITPTGIFAILPFYLDPLIYTFKPASRLTRVIGRKFFGISFVGEELGVHDHQTYYDLLIIGLSVLSVVVFFGVLIPAPFNKAVAWTLGLSSVSIAAYFDYYWPEKKADKLYQDTHALPNHHPNKKTLLEQRDKQYKDLKLKRYLYIATIIGCMLFFISGSAALFATASYSTMLHGLSKFGSTELTIVFLTRGSIWINEGGPAALFATLKGGPTALLTAMKGLIWKNKDNSLDIDIHPDTRAIIPSPSSYNVMGIVPDRTPLTNPTNASTQELSYVYAIFPKNQQEKNILPPETEASSLSTFSYTSSFRD